MLIENKTTKIVCDWCKSKITENTKTPYKCPICKKDVCWKCGYDIRQTIKERKYNYATKKIARICVSCYESKIVRKTQKEVRKR